MTDINPIYSNYMLEHFPQNPTSQWNHCFDYTETMQKDFPELTIKKGYVYSYDNIDNPHPKYPKQYPHCWLIDKDKNIIDPTLNQFSLLGKLHYVEADLEVLKFNCAGCGQFSKDVYCNECPWSFVHDIQKLLISLKTNEPYLSRNWEVTIFFRGHKPVVAEWSDLIKNSSIRIRSTFQRWENGFLHFHSTLNDQIINETELKLSEKFLLETNLGKEILATAVCSSGTYTSGIAVDNSD